MNNYGEQVRGLQLAIANTEDKDGVIALQKILISVIMNAWEASVAKVQEKNPTHRRIDEKIRVESWAEVPRDMSDKFPTNNTIKHWYKNGIPSHSLKNNKIGCIKELRTLTETNTHILGLAFAKKHVEKCIGEYAG